MAELVASIIGISGAALKLSNGLYKVAIALKNAGQEVRVIANDTAQFSRVLKELSNSLGSDDPSIARAREITEDVVATCRSIQNDGEKLLIILRPLIEQSKGSTSFSNIILKIRWLFERSKFAYHRDLLATLKSTLQLLVSVIIMKTMPTRDTISHLVDEVVNLRHIVQSGMYHMENNLQSSQLLEAFQPQTSLPALSGNVTILAIEGPNRIEAETAASHSSDAAPDDGTSSSNDMAVQGQEEQSDSAKSGSEEGFAPAAGAVGPLALLPYFRAYLAQEKVCQYANEALESVQYDQDGNPFNVQPSSESNVNTQLSTSSTSDDQTMSRLSTQNQIPTTTMDNTKNGLNFVAESAHGASYAASKEANKNVVKNGNPPAQDTVRGDTLPASISEDGPSTSSAGIVVESPTPGSSITPIANSGLPVQTQPSTSMAQPYPLSDLVRSQPPFQARDIAQSKKSSDGSGSTMERGPLSNQDPAVYGGMEGLKASPYHVKPPSSQHIDDISASSNVTDLQSDEPREVETEPEPDPDVVFFVTHEAQQIPMPFSKCRTYDGLVESVKHYGLIAQSKSPYWRDETQQAVKRLRREQERDEQRGWEPSPFLFSCTGWDRGMWKGVTEEKWPEVARPDTLIRIYFDRPDLAQLFNSQTKEDIEEQMRTKEEMALKAIEKAEKPAEIEERRGTPRERKARRFNGLFNLKRT